MKQILSDAVFYGFLGIVIILALPLIILFWVLGKVGFSNGLS